jgi:enoyl-CoA hydratase/carnithine racemase
MLTLSHDRRVANAERGWFCLPEVDLGMQFLPFQLALITSRLPALVADEAILTGNRYDGPAAVAAGISHAAAPPEALLAAAIEVAVPYAGKQRGSVQALKVQLNAATLALLPPPPGTPAP